MPRLITRKEKDLRVQNQIEDVLRLYDLTYEGIESNLLNLQTFKIDLKLDVTQNSLMMAVDQLELQMKILNDLQEVYRKNVELKTLRERLKQVRIQIVSILRKEFRSVKGLTGLRGSTL